VLRLNEELKVTKTKNRLGAGKREYFFEFPRFGFPSSKVQRDFSTTDYPDYADYFCI